MKHNVVRIIGGQWRGRKLHFPAISGLRPTPDRVRETVFNWLAPVIHGAYCLDLFAGSGALGLEALSRGATHVTFIDQDREIVNYLKQQLVLLKIERANVYYEKFPLIKNNFTKNFNIVFLDPPFNQNLITTCCQWLTENNLLAPNAYIYLETEAELKPLPIPDDWELIKSKIAGQVGYHLARYNNHGINCGTEAGGGGRDAAGAKS
jgi:16S rRNA (guanine966-N2)-methyltransferase